jgi:hypothetical protein
LEEDTPQIDNGVERKIDKGIWRKYPLDTARSLNYGGIPREEAKPLAS